MKTHPWIHGVRKNGIQSIPKNLRFAENEWLGFQALSSQFKSNHFEILSTGDRTSVQISPMEFMIRVLEHRPRGLLIFHNHPSGCLIPSDADIRLTEKIEHLCFEIGILFLGHAIVYKNRNRWIDFV